MSDNTDAYERIKTQFGNFYFYLPSVMSVHIGRTKQGFNDEYLVACLDVGHAEMKGLGTNAVE